MDKRIFALGIAMLAAGLLFWLYFYNNEPVSRSDMTEEETSAYYEQLVINTSLRNISQLVAGIGFFITLISLGLKRRKKGGVGKSITQKPAQT
jgi:hypothetical protein